MPFCVRAMSRSSQTDVLFSAARPNLVVSTHTLRAGLASVSQGQALSRAFADLLGRGEFDWLFEILMRAMVVVRSDARTMTVQLRLPTEDDGC